MKINQIRQHPYILWLPLGMVLLCSFLSACIVVAGHPRGHRGAVVIHPIPPPIVVTATPRLVFMAQYGIHVAPDVEVSLFFHDNAWFYFHGGGWYKGPAYRGPWTPIKAKRLPPGLRKVPPGQLKKMAKEKGTRERRFK